MTVINAIMHGGGKLTAVETFKKEHPDIDLKIQYRGDGTVLLDISKGEKKVVKALSKEEMRTFFKLITISEQSANDFLLVTIEWALKEIEDEN